MHKNFRTTSMCRVELNNPFLTFEGKSTTQSPGLDTEGSALKVWPGSDGLNRNCRALWHCPDLANDLRHLDHLERKEVAIEFPALDEISDAIQWIGFLSKKGKKYKLFQKILDRESLLELSLNGPISIRGEVEKMPLDEELFLACQLNRMSDPVTIGPPAISWIRDDFIGILDIYFKNRKLKITGWAVDEKSRALPTRVELEYNGDTVDSKLARTRLSEEEKRLYPKGAHKFELCCFVQLSGQVPNIQVRNSKKYSIKVDLKKCQVDEALTQPKILSKLSPNSIVMGKFEQLNGSQAVGWAICPDQPDAPIDLILSLNDIPISHTVTNIQRLDVQEKYGGTGLSGFRFEIPANVGVSESVRISVNPLSGQNRIRKHLRHLTPVGKVFLPTNNPVMRSVTNLKSANNYEKASVIILNRNCAPLLSELIASTEQHESKEQLEWIIVDHNSADNSSDVCEDLADKGHVIKFLRRNGNFSFSESNNYGARCAKHNNLIFANNDLIFEGPFVKNFLTQLANDQIGLVGTSLYDYLEPSLSSLPTRPIQHLGVYFNPMTTGKKWIRPYEARLNQETATHIENVISVPAVTGALFAMRKDDFISIGGFDERYIYGLEDIDLCCKVTHKLSKEIICDNSIKAIHRRGYSRKKEENLAVRHRNNNNIFNAEWGNILRQEVKRDVLRRPSYWTGSRPVVGFIVSDAGDDTTAGEYFTALEFGRALQKIAPVHLKFLVEESWYDLTGVDILVVMVNGFKLDKVMKASPFLITINWTRQWFDRWAEDHNIQSYDLVFASSKRAAEFLVAKTGRDVSVLPIATNYDEFSRAGAFSEDYQCDYCLTGNRGATPRAIENNLVPESIDGVGAIYGAHWEQTRLAKISRGPVSYQAVPNIYASTKIVVDDSNVATKEWGSCNSRVFDAIASGCLLVTNGKLGVEELFGDLLPTYDDAVTLTNVLQYWLEHDEERELKVSELRDIVKRKHTYDHRAEVVYRALMPEKFAVRIAIKISATFSAKEKWGDYHFAESLAKSLRKLNFIVTVDCLESWNRGTSESDDVVIVLRGLRSYSPRPNQKNILWLISHPREVPMSEFDAYDHIFVASSCFAKKLENSVDVPVDVLLQCSDTDRFRPSRTDLDELERSEKPLFVGNSRGIFRPVVKWCMELEKDIDIYGGGWEQFVTDERLRGTLIPNEVLSGFYEYSIAVLCDHWDDMKRDGFISNRAFDVLAAGGQLVIDDVRDVDKVLPGGYKKFKNREELDNILRNLEFDTTDTRFERAAWVKKFHSFDVRASILSEKILDLLKGG